MSAITADMIVISDETTARIGGPQRVIAIRGPLDVTTAAGLRDRLVRPPHPAFRETIVDLSAVDRVDVAGLTSLVAGISHARRRGDRLSVVGPHGAALTSLDIAGLLPFLDLR